MCSNLKPNWYGMFHDAPAIPNLSRNFSIEQGLRFCVDYAGQNDEAACRDLVVQSRSSGDNVGLGEYLNEFDLLALFKPSDVFAVKMIVSGNKCRDNNCLSAVVVVQPSLHARTWDSCLARIHIFRSSEFHRNMEFYRELLHSGVHIARLLDVGYTRCIMYVASNLVELVQVTRQEGFLIVATIPEGVKLAGVGGACDDLIMLNSLGVTNRKRRSREEIDKLLNRMIPLIKDATNLIEEEPRLIIPFLPQTYIFSNGLSTTVRMMEDHEAQYCYKILKTAAEKGQGFGIDEFPTFESFRIQVLEDHYCIVIVDPSVSTLGSQSSDRIVGISLITDSSYTRNPDAQLGESSLIISEEYRGLGLAKEAAALEYSIMKELGYLGSLNDALLSNNHMNRVVKSNKFPTSTIGVISDGTFTVGYGWDDQVISLIYFKEAKEMLCTFSVEAERSRLCNSTQSKL